MPDLKPYDPVAKSTRVITTHPEPPALPRRWVLLGGQYPSGLGDSPLMRLTWTGEDDTMILIEHSDEGSWDVCISLPEALCEATFAQSILISYYPRRIGIGESPDTPHVREMPLYHQIRPSKRWVTNVILTDIKMGVNLPIGIGFTLA